MGRRRTARLARVASTGRRCLRLLAEVTGIDLSWLKLRLPIVVLAILGLSAFFRLPHVDPMRGSGVGPLLVEVIENSNEGRFYQFSDSTSIRMGSIDDGFWYYPSLTIQLLKAVLGESYRADFSIVYGLQLLFFSLAVVCFFLAPVPARLAWGALFCLGLGLTRGTYPISFYGQWCTSLAILIALLFLLTLSSRISGPPRSIYFAAACFGGLVGLLGLWRRDAELVAIVMATLYLLFGGVQLLMARVAERRQGEFDVVKRRIWTLAAVPVFMAAIFLPGLLSTAHYRFEQWSGGVQHFREGMSSGKSVWHNAYIGLGVIPNEYGLEYLDTVGYLHAMEEQPTLGHVGISSLSDDYDRVLRRLFMRAVVNDPQFVFGGYRVKLTQLAAAVDLGAWLVYGLALLIGFSFAERRVLGVLYPWAFVALGTALLAAALPPLLTVVGPIDYYKLALEACLVGGPILLFLLVLGRKDSPTAAGGAPNALNGSVALVAMLVLLLLGGTWTLVQRSHWKRVAYFEEVAGLDGEELLRELSQKKRRFETTLQSVFSRSVTHAARREFVEALDQKLKGQLADEVVPAEASQAPLLLVEFLVLPDRFVVFLKSRQRVVPTEGRLFARVFPRAAVPVLPESQTGEENIETFRGSRLPDSFIEDYFMSTIPSRQLPEELLNSGGAVYERVVVGYETVGGEMMEIATVVRPRLAVAQDAHAEASASRVVQPDPGALRATRGADR